MRMRFTSVAPIIWLIRTCRRIPGWLSSGPTYQLRRDTAEIWKRVAAHIVAARIRSLLNVDARELLGKCPAPVLCIAGSNDGVVPWRNVEEIVRVRPSVSVCRIKGRHFAIYTNPTATMEAITGFMETKRQNK